MRKSYTPEEYQAREKMILDTALALLEKKNYSNITMRELSKACGLALGTLFNYFDSKEILFRKLLYDFYYDYFTEEIQLMSLHEFDTFEDYKNYQLERVEILAERHALISLLSVHQNVYTVSESTDATDDRRTRWADKLIELGRLIHEKVPVISEDNAVRYYYFLHALLVGYSNLFNVPGMAQPPLFLSNAKQETILSVKCYLDGISTVL